MAHDKLYVLDRFEEGVAVLVSDDGHTVSVPGLAGREGDVFALQADGWTLRPDAREARLRNARAKMDRLFGKRDRP